MSVIRHLRSVDFSTGEKGDLVIMEITEGSICFRNTAGDDISDEMSLMNHFYPYRPDNPGCGVMLDGLVRMEFTEQPHLYLASMAGNVRDPDYPTLRWISDLQCELLENDIWHEILQRKGKNGAPKITDALRLEA